MKQVKVCLILIVIALFAIALFGCSEAYSLKFSSESYTVKSGISFVPNIKIHPKNAEYQIVSSNNTIATVENNIISTKKEGVVTLTLTSGKKEDTATLYILDETDEVSTDIIIKDVFFISFIATNFEIANLENELLQTVAAIEGNILNISTPYVKGYAINGWYTDRACSDKYDMATVISGAFKLYCYLTEQTNSYNVVNKLITGITYDNLEHTVLDLPSKEKNGNEIIGIDDNAFKGDTSITKVIIPDNYTIIGASAFAGCTNLLTVELGENSTLKFIGTNAFGTVTKEGSDETACSKLKTINLPDCVEQISAFAFYKCTALVLANIPSSLEEVSQYSFYGTQIASADCENVEVIMEGAFGACSKLTSVTNTGKVIYCDKEAFLEAGFYLTAINKYVLATGGRKDEDAIFYADTILIGCYSKFGRLLGSGKIKIAEKTTLIANEAFYDTNLTELTINIDTPKARAVIASKEYNFIGKNAIIDTKGVSLVVGSSDYQSYIDRYSIKDMDYKNQICTEEIIEVVGDNNMLQINWGKHTLLKFIKNNTEFYHYDKFTPFASGTPQRIELSTLKGENYNLDRINSNAFNGITNLIALDLGNTLSIGYMAISNCANLEDIDLTNTAGFAVLENANSIQFSSLKQNGGAYVCKVYVKTADYELYRTAWKKFSTAYSSLTKRA